MRFSRKSLCALSLSFGALAAFATPVIGPLSLLAGSGYEPVPFGAVGEVSLLGVALLRGPGDDVGLPAALVKRQPVRAGVNLSDRGHDALEERPVVGHDDQPAAAAVQEVLEPLEAIEVEVVGGLVQQDDVEPGQQEGRERRPCRLSAGKL